MRPNQENALSGSTHVFIRFGFRLAILIVFAAVAQIGFGQALTRFLLLAGLFCGLWAALRCEPIFGPVLTHWDEAAGLIVLGKLTAFIA
jgi:hypothetical protein